MPINTVTIIRFEGNVCEVLMRMKNPNISHGRLAKSLFGGGPLGFSLGFPNPSNMRILEQKKIIDVS